MKIDIKTVNIVILNLVKHFSILNLLELEQYENRPLVYYSVLHS